MEGRRREFKFDIQQHGSPLPDCQAQATFLDSKLRWNELEQSPYRENLALYREAFRLRRQWFGPKNPSRDIWDVEVRSGHLVIDYRLPDLNVAVVLLPAHSASVHTIEDGTVLLRSGDIRFGGSRNAEVPETVVVARS